MATVTKDFKVKNGLIVNGNGSFSGTITAATPTSPNHLATKAYVDARSGGGTSTGANIYVGNVEPTDAVDGAQWFDVTVKRLKIFYGNEWYTLASSDDAFSVTEHTHDPVSGLVMLPYIYGGDPLDSDLSLLDGGSPYTINWYQVLDGGYPLEQLYDAGDPYNTSVYFADGMAPETQSWDNVFDGNGVTV